MSATMKVITSVITIATLFVFCFQVDVRYAKSGELNATDIKIDLYILEEDYKSTRDRMWALESKYPGRRPPVIQNEIKHLQDTLRSIDEQKETTRSRAR